MWGLCGLMAGWALTSSYTISSALGRTAGVSMYGYYSLFQRGVLVLGVDKHANISDTCKHSCRNMGTEEPPHPLLDCVQIMFEGKAKQIKIRKIKRSC